MTTPNYYVQQLFAKHIGKKLLETSYETYVQGEKINLVPCGGVVISAEGDVEFKTLKIIANKGKKVLLEQKFADALADGVVAMTKGSRNGYYLNRPDWKNYTVEVTAVKKTDDAELYVGVGLNASNPEKADLLEYGVGTHRGTGLKVIKGGVEGYTLGDYSSSVFAGNLRACYDEVAPAGKEYTITVNYGGKDGKSIICYYGESGSKEKKGLLDNKLEAYNRDVFHSVTADAEKVYAKLVNAENFDKKVLVKLDNLAVKNKAEVIVLTGESELVHKPNVNTKEKEWVVPAGTKATVKNNALELVLPANSVNVVVLDRA